ncbi:MAG: EamA family transporter [Pimelobacter sp.]|nr:EamA family transporter [Pimelobacter sp.]
MTGNSSAIVNASPALSPGLGWGLLGVLAFSLTVPLTRIAVDGMSPLFIGVGRAVVAAALAATVLALTRQRLPRGPEWRRLVVVAAGVVLGFPLLTSYALQSVPAGHGAVVIGLLPAATAVVAVLRGGERPSARFWRFAGLGVLATVGFVTAQGGGLGGVGWADLLLLGAVVAAAVGYAEGGLLARSLGAWQTVSWALVVAVPVTAVLTVVAVGQQPPTATTGQWVAFAYLAAVSMFLGFVAWYRGLAIGPIATVSQVQLVQPVLSIGWATLLLGEHLTVLTALGALAVVACAAGAVRARSPRPSPVPSPRRRDASAVVAGAGPCADSR